MSHSIAKNLILISIDTLRDDVAYHGPMPSLQSFFSSCVTYSSAFASAPITPVSHASVFTGMTPDQHGLRHLFRERLSCRESTLAEVLCKSGFRTAAIVSCPGLHRWYKFDRGFEHYDDEIPLMPDGRDPLKVVDAKTRGLAAKDGADVVERATRLLSQLSAGNDRFFLFVHFFDLHWPYEPPNSYMENTENAYEGEAAYVDDALAKLVQVIGDLGLFQDTEIVVFGDHGEDLNGWYKNDHGIEYPEESGHGSLLFDNTIRVPLGIKRPDSSQSRVVEDQVRLIDILPTVAADLGIEDDVPRSGIVLPVENGSSDRLVIAETFYREEVKGYGELFPWVCTRWHGQKVITDIGVGRSMVFDLASDPHERNPHVVG